jgi:hypothetical protein
MMQQCWAGSAVEGTGRRAGGMRVSLREHLSSSDIESMHENQESMHENQSLRAK